jgi:hypothetical protein
MWRREEGPNFRGRNWCELPGIPEQAGIIVVVVRHCKARRMTVAVP